MHTYHWLVPRILTGLCLGTVLMAQVARERDGVPLKPWPAALYWQPSESETRERLAATPAGAMVFVAMTPCRIMDTRAGSGFTGSFGPPSLPTGSSRTVSISDSTACPIPPDTAQAYSFNVTVVPPGPLGFITLYPAGAPQPGTSTLNDPLGIVLANAAVVPAGSNGSINVFANNTTDVILDINGYYAPLGGLTLAPGKVGAPSVSFVGDPGTGIFSPGAGTMSFATGGASRFSILPSGDVDVSGNIRRNGLPFLNTLGATSIGLGINALGVNTAQYNTAFGYIALANNTTGFSNTAQGYNALNANTTGNNNTAHGTNALAANTTGNFNTATGVNALSFNTTGINNTGDGVSALYANSTGHDNTASGVNALAANTTGYYNTGNGADALMVNTTGTDNTASGAASLSANTTGSFNTGAGSGALAFNTTGTQNAALGAIALYYNTTGSFNAACGAGALGLNTTGGSNTALGYNALNDNTTGNNNTASGKYALYFNTTGHDNVALGLGAGSLNPPAANFNIDIGNQGLGTDNGVIRIGAANQTATYIAGIRGVTTGSAAVNVVVDSFGQLGTVSSSRRFKQDIHDMGEASTGLLHLRPVTFRYQKPYADGSRPLDYGLIAEEVADVYPDLVVKDKDGQVETVQYQKLTPMLLNELQRQHLQLESAREELKAGRILIRSLETRLAVLEAQRDPTRH